MDVDAELDRDKFLYGVAYEQRTSEGRRLRLDPTSIMTHMLPKDETVTIQPAEPIAEIDGLRLTFRILEPGDKVLLIADQPISADAAHRAKTILDNRFPDVEFTVTGGFKAIIQPAE